MGRKRALIAGKHLIYCFGLIFCYVLQTTPGLSADLSASSPFW